MLYKLFIRIFSYLEHFQELDQR